MERIQVRDVRVVVCYRCRGEGCLEEATGGEDVFRVVACPVCGGARVLERRVTVEYKRLQDGNKSEKECTPVAYRADGARGEDGEPAAKQG